MGGPAGVLGRSSGGLGLAWGFMGGAWCVLGVAWSVLGGPWEVLERPSRCLWESLEVLGRSSGDHRGSWDVPWEVFEGPWGSLGGTPPNRSWGVLGVDGEIKASPGRDSDAPMGALDRLRTRPDRLGTHPDVSPNATRSSLDRPKGPRSAQGRPKASNVNPKDAHVCSRS